MTKRPRRFPESLLALLGIIVLAIAVSPVASDGGRIFLQPGNLTDILRQISLIGIISVGMTFVILTAGIDLSVGSILALSTVVVSMGLARQGHSIAVSILLALGASAAVGALNGVVAATLRMQPFVVTLATMIGVRGLAKWLSSNENIDIGFGHDLAATFAASFSRKVVIIGTYVALAGSFWVLLTRTVFGRYVRAVGDNPKAAEYAGLPIRATKVWVYGLSGLLSGIAGVLYTAENHQGNPNSGVAYELDAIAAVVIGGTRLSGGKGSISGTIVGALFMGILTNMLRLNNVDSNVEMMIKAVLIVLAVAAQRERKAK
jgi:ribose transport system permease protein